MSPKKRFGFLETVWFRRAFTIAVIICAAALAAMLSFLGARSVVRSAPGAPHANGPQLSEGTTAPIFNEQGTPIAPAANPNAPESAPELTPWDGVGRVTVLLMGLDYRDWEQSDGGPSRSDTMILLTLDPLNKTAGILSIPRDMWVEIPGFTHGKINTAYYLGDAYKLPGGGPGLAVKTVEQFLGVPINYYAQIDFGAFVRFIDEIGGVKIDVPEPIEIDLLGKGSSTKKVLQPGVQVLPGEWALAYARNRHTQGGDFDRARRQQQVIFGIRDRVLRFDMLPTLIAKSPKLYQELSSGINTNLTLEDATKLALLAKDVPEDKIKHGVLGEGYVIFGWSPDKLSILIPIPDKIHLLRDEIFAASGSLSPQTPGNPREQMVAEGASLAVYNGSRDPGLGERVTNYLQSQGASVQVNTAADDAYAATRIVDHTGNPYLVRYLVDLFKIQPGRITFDYQPDAPQGVELTLGYDAEGIELP